MTLSIHEERSSKFLGGSSISPSPSPLLLSGPCEEAY